MQFFCTININNNLSIKTELKSYSPQEELIVSLGVDPAIKIDYKPIRKFKGQNGLLAKTTITTYSQVYYKFSGL